MSDNTITDKQKTRKRCPKNTKFVPSRNMCLPKEEALQIIQQENDEKKKNKTRKKKPIIINESIPQQSPSIIENTSNFMGNILTSIQDTISNVSTTEKQEPEPEEDKVEPEDGEVEPEDGEVEPEDGEVEPEDGEVEPEDGEDEPEDGQDEPEEDEVDSDDEKEKDDSPISEQIEQEPTEEKIYIQEEDVVDDEQNAQLFEREKEHFYNKNDEQLPDHLYPLLDDSDFAVRIASKKEFNDHQFQSNVGKDIESGSKEECEKEFEFMPHQQFLKNFMSLDTPYNSILLYHELGTGKTCSAIGITEEMREYMKQTGYFKKIMIIASPNVQDNFKKQLFDSSRLQKMKNGSWNLNTCVGAKFLKEINPTNIENQSREQVIKSIKVIIRKYYRFMGYDSVALYSDSDVKHLQKKEERKRKKQGGPSFIEHIETELPEILDLEPIRTTDSENTKTQKRNVIKKLREKFDYRLIVVDEFHNMIARRDNLKKSTAKILYQIVRYCKYTRLILLSATPLYNSHEEIIWVTNIMNINDKRAIIQKNQVFDKDGNFVEEKTSKDGLIVQESGEQLLRRKLTGYVSYVRGENPYTFPFRIYPSYFADNTNLMTTYTYPSKQFNGYEITETPKKYVLDKVYVNIMQKYQSNVYNRIVNSLKKEIEDFDSKKSFNFQVLGVQLNSLNMTYPHETLNIEDNKEDVSTKFLYGKEGLYNIMNYETLVTPVEQLSNFEYKPLMLKKYGRIFELDKIGTYSSKIESICKAVQNSTGIVLIYSRYLEEGLLPVALALEEMGITRYSYASHIKPFFKKGKPYLNPLTMKPKTGNDKYIAKYTMITGTKLFSPNNEQDLELVMNPENKDGKFVKVVMISEAGSEGLDFKCIRQVHILEPWYNMSRIEQIIGRGVRNKSHCSLPLEQRNVEIYMHVSYNKTDYETADMYMYRLAEEKAIQIGKITRILKESAIDCLLSQKQNDFMAEKMKETLEISLSANNKKITYKIGDKPFSSKCDYMEDCELTCKPSKDVENINNTTYNIRHIQQSKEGIVKRIRELYRDRPFFTLKELLTEIQAINKYPIEEVYYTLSQFIKNKQEWVIHKKQIGYIIRHNDVYVFQPNELQDQYSSIFERTTPFYNKPKDYTIQIKKDEIKKVKDNLNIDKSDDKMRESIMDVVGTNNEDTLHTFKQQTKTPTPSALGKMIETKIQTPARKYETLISTLQETVEFWKKDINIYLGDKTNEKATKSKLITHTGYRVYQILNNFHKMDGNEIVYHMIHHILDTTLYAERVNYVNELFRAENDFTKKIKDSYDSPLEDIIFSYFHKKMVYHSTEKYYTLCLAKANKLAFIVWKNGIWREATPLEKENKELIEWLNHNFQKNTQVLEKVREEHKNVQYTTEAISELESIVGFIGVNKSSLESDGYSFKLKNMLKIRNAIGASCEQASRETTIDRLDSIKTLLGKQEQTYNIVGDNIFVEIENSTLRITKHHICLIYEIFLRSIKTDGWFLSPEESVHTDITRLSIQFTKSNKMLLFDLVEKNKN